MKKLLSITLLLSSLTSNAMVSIDGKYTVANDNCDILFIGEKALISNKLKQDTKINLKFQDKIVSTSLYEGYAILGKKLDSFSNIKSFDKNYNKNTATTLQHKSESILFTQETKPFSYYSLGEICHPYDMTGLSCAAGILNPMNWVPKKGHFVGVTFKTVITKEANGDVEYARYLVEDKLETLTHECLLTPVL